MSLLDRLALLLLVAALASPLPLHAQTKCQKIEQDVRQQSELATNMVARERAAIEDLKNPKLDEAYKRMLSGWGDREYREESEKWSQGLRCISAEAELKHYQIGVAEEKRLIELGCQRSKISQYKLDSVKDREKGQAKECGKVDPAYHAGMVKQLEDIKAAKLANEEKPSVASKKADVAAKDTPFCKQIVSISKMAQVGFKPIIGAKKPDIMFGGTAVPMPVDSFPTSVSPAFADLPMSANCDVTIGNLKEPNPVLRVRPLYSCKWNFERTNRKQLEESADELLNATRGCFSKIEEQKSDDAYNRHEFIADDSVTISGIAYYGEGKPSHIRLDISKYAPGELMACSRWMNGSQRE